MLLFCRNCESVELEKVGEELLIPLEEGIKRGYKVRCKNCKKHYLVEED